MELVVKELYIYLFMFLYDRFIFIFCLFIEYILIGYLMLEI